jgi:long-chain acyl-CoA synthetase
VKSLADWASKQGIDTSKVEMMLAHEKVQKLIERDIERINVRFGAWEQVKAFRLLPRQFTINEGEITPTLKLKRKKILENWQHLVDDIYRRN